MSGPVVVARNRCLSLLLSEIKETPSKQITAVHSGGTVVAVTYGVPVITHCHSQLSTVKGVEKVVSLHVTKAYRGSRITTPPILYISMPFHSQITKCCPRYSD